MTVAIEAANEIRNPDLCPACGTAHTLQLGWNECEGCQSTWNAVRAQPGPQSRFLSKDMRHVDILGYGGAAGGGKTWALLLDPLKDMHVPGFGGVLFRRQATQITNEGGLWDTSMTVYPGMGADPRKTPVHQWIWPNENRLVFTHLQLAEDVHSHQGGQYCWLGFDELTHFLETQFWYLMSRNRSTCGVKPRARCSFNPDAGSWVKILFAPWVDDEYPDPAKHGEVRYLVRLGRTENKPAEYHYFRRRKNAERFASKAHHLPLEQLGDSVKSVSFIEADLYDNVILMEKDPSYLANLLALDEVDRERLLYKNWKILVGRFFREWRATRVDGSPWHVIPTGPVPQGLTYYLGVDWGFSAPYASYLMVVDYNGRVTMCRETYGTEKLTSAQGDEMLAMLESNKDQDGESWLEQDEVPMLAPHDTFNRRLRSSGEYDEPIVYTWQRQGFQAHRGGRDPQARAHKYREYLRDWGPDEGWPDGRPGLQVMECCINFIRTLPLLMGDPHNPEQVDTTGDDHAYDAAGHVLTALPARPDRPKPRKDWREKRVPLEEDPEAEEAERSAFTRLLDDMR